MNLAENLERSAFYFPDHPAVIYEERKFSYYELNQYANRVATGLIKLGILPGDHIGLCAPNSFEWLTFYFGVLKAGAVAVTLPSMVSQSELIRLLDDARPKILLTIDEKLDALKDRKDRPYLEKVVSENGDISYSKLLVMGSNFLNLFIETEETQQRSYTQEEPQEFLRE